MSEKKKEMEEWQIQEAARVSYDDLKNAIEGTIDLFHENGWRDLRIIMYMCWLIIKGWLELVFDYDGDDYLFKADLESSHHFWDFIDKKNNEEGTFESLKKEGISNIYGKWALPEEYLKYSDILSPAAKGYDLDDREAGAMINVWYCLKRYLHFNKKKDPSWIYDYILSVINGKTSRDSSPLYQSTALTHLVVSILDAKEGTVFNPYAGACYYGAELSANLTYCGEVSDEHACSLGRLNLLVHDRKNATCSVTKQKEERIHVETFDDFKIEENKYDYIISTSLCGASVMMRSNADRDAAIKYHRKEERNEPISKEEEDAFFGAVFGKTEVTYEALYLENSTKAARRKAIGVYPLSVCDDNDMDVNNTDLIEAVILLPNTHDISNPYGEPSVIIVTNKEKTKKGVIRFVDASKCFRLVAKSDDFGGSCFSYENVHTKGLKVKEILALYRQEGTGGDVADISIEEIKSTHYSLNPTRYKYWPTPKDGEKRLSIRDVMETLQPKDGNKRTISIKDLSDNYLNCDIQDDPDADVPDTGTICLLAGFHGGKFRVGRLKGKSSTPTSSFAREIIPFVLNPKVKDRISEDFILRSVMRPETEAQARAFDLGSEETKWGDGFDRDGYIRDFRDLKIIVPSRDEQDRLCKEDKKKSAHAAADIFIRQYGVNWITEMFKEVLFEEVEHKTDDMIKKRHADAFKYMGEGRLLDKKTETIMLDVLNVMYNPDGNQRFKDYIGNPIRQVIEALFFAAHDKGLLPDECFNKISKSKDDEKKTILMDCSRYMAGINTICGNRFGEKGKGKDGKGGDSIFPDDEATLLRGCINICNESSHFNPKKEKPCDEAYLT